MLEKLEEARHAGEGPEECCVEQYGEDVTDGVVALDTLGLGGVEQARRVAPIACVQNRHAPGYERSDAGTMLTRCGELGIAFVPFFAIAGRNRENTAEEQHDTVREIAHAHRATPAQVRIAWNLALGPHVLAIPGTGDLGHLEQNITAASLRLTRDELAAISALE